MTEDKVSWLDILTYSTRQLEPPERFFWWAGLATISAIVKRKVWLDRFSYNLYPNVYVILVSARSGLRKGIPISYANAIANKVGVTRTIAGRNTIQGIIKVLGDQTTLASGEIIKDAQAFLCTGELDSFLVRDDQALSILTDLYNTHENSDGWDNTLKNSPVSRLISPCVTLLGASNEELLESVLQQKDIKGGFLARSFIIHERSRRTKNSLIERPEGLIPKSELAESIAFVKDLKGPFKWSDRVKKEYDEWYMDLEIDNDSDVTGVMERIGDSVLKVAMLISLSKGPGLEISLYDMRQAIDKCEGFLSGHRKVTMTHGKSEIAPFVGIVLKTLIEEPTHELERMKFLRRIHPNVDAMMFDRVMDDLGDVRGKGVVQMGRRGNKVFYRMKEEIVEQYKALGGKVRDGEKGTIQ